MQLAIKLNQKRYQREKPRSFNDFWAFLRPFLEAWQKDAKMGFGKFDGPVPYLTDMYNLSVYYSAKDNTMSYLSDFDYKQKSSYKLEHLMMSEKQALPKAFAAEALSLDRESVGDLFDILVKRVVSHALVFRSDFENALTQQLQDKFFPNKDTQKKIRIQRIQNKRIETE